MTFTANDRIVGPVTPAFSVELITIDFYFEDETEIEVYQAGSNTPLTLGVDYTVQECSEEGVADGSITLIPSADGSTAYTIFGAQPLERTSDIQFRGDLNSTVINRSFDRLWRALTDLDTRLRRTFRFSAVSDIPGEIDSQSAAGRIGKVVGFNSDGTEFSLVATVEATFGVPGASLDNAVPRFNGTGGNAIQASNVTIDDTNVMTGVESLRFQSSSGDGYADITGAVAGSIFYDADPMDEEVDSKHD